MDSFLEQAEEGNQLIKSSFTEKWSLNGIGVGDNFEQSHLASDGVVINALLVCWLFQLSDARIEIAKLQGQCKEQQELIDRLQAELENTVDEYSTLSYQSRMVIALTCLWPYYQLL